MRKHLGGPADEGLRGDIYDGRPGGDRADCGQAGERRGGGVFFSVVFCSFFDPLVLTFVPCLYCDGMLA